jgi:CRISPR/Cas system-associated endonuclease Cas1
MGYMVIRGEETHRVFLDEIAIVLIENPAVALTCCLLEALNERKIRVIFCGAKRSPVAELVPYYGSSDSSGKIRNQIAWTAEARDAVWHQILAEKIQSRRIILLCEIITKKLSSWNLICNKSSIRIRQIGRGTLPRSISMPCLDLVFPGAATHH